MQDLETNPDYKAWIAMCLQLNIDPENTDLELGEYRHKLQDFPWFNNWVKKQERMGEPDKINGYDDGEAYERN